MPHKKKQQAVIEKDSPEYFMSAIEHTDWSVAKAKKNGDKLMLPKKVAEIGKCLCELAHECEYSAYYLEQAMRDGAGDSMMPSTLGDECKSMAEKAESYKGVAFKYKQKFGVHPTEAYSAFGKKWEPSDHKTRYESETGGKMVTKKMSVFESITEIEADALLAEMHRAEKSRAQAMSLAGEIRYQDDKPEEGEWRRYTGPRGGKGWERTGGGDIEVIESPDLQMNRRRESQEKLLKKLNEKKGIVPGATVYLTSFPERRGVVEGVGESGYFSVRFPEGDVLSGAESTHWSVDKENGPKDFVNSDGFKNVMKERQAFINKLNQDDEEDEEDEPKPVKKPYGGPKRKRFEVVSGDNSDYAKPPTDEEAKAALDKRKVEKFGLARLLEEGTDVALRIDIPAFNNHGVYVVTVHEDNGSDSRVGSVVGYDTMARLKGDVSFWVKEDQAEMIATDSPKFPIATVRGGFDRSREMPEDIDNWTPVGCDPQKAPFFYDKTTGDEVVGGVDAVSVGNTVFVRQPKYGKRNSVTLMSIASK